MHCTNTSGSFETTGLIDVLRKLGPIMNNNTTSHTTTVEDLQAEGFAIPFNPPLTRIHDPILVQVSPFGEPKLTEYRITSDFIMDNTREGLRYIFTPTLDIVSRGLSYWLWSLIFLI